MTFANSSGSPSQKFSSPTQNSPSCSPNRPDPVGDTAIGYPVGQRRDVCLRLSRSHDELQGLIDHRSGQNKI